MPVSLSLSLSAVAVGCRSLSLSLASTRPAHAGSAILGRQHTQPTPATHQQARLVARHLLGPASNAVCVRVWV